MKKGAVYIKKIILGSIILCIAITFYGKVSADIGEVSLTILKGYLTIKETGNISIGQITTSPTAQTITGTLNTNTFQLQDKVGGCSGFYTTLQADHLIYGSNKITNENISIKSLTSPNTMFGAINPEVKIGTNIQNNRSAINRPKTYIYRQTGLGCSIVGQYADNTELKINVPANQPTGTYKGKLYYLIIDKESAQ